MTLVRLAQILRWEQQAVKAKCFHASGTFMEFSKEEVEQLMCLHMECLRLFLGGC